MPDCKVCAVSNYCVIWSCGPCCAVETPSRHCMTRRDSLCRLSPAARFTQRPDRCSFVRGSVCVHASTQWRHWACSAIRYCRHG